MKKSAAMASLDLVRHVEQRREPRWKAHGEIWFSLDEGAPAGPAPKEVLGTLLDRSSSGFRAQHDCKELMSGQLVRFRMKPSSGGRARVMWTRIIDDRVESGFLIVR
ncbi:MAG TPA: hypothetical protein VLX58_05235 [Bryobacteraceae bacterium]|nr:hypothetical protein [Bryobacteraceae bacterium]